MYWSDWQEISTIVAFIKCSQTFLADYGMIWCGQTTDPESDVYIRDDKVSDGTAASDDDDTLTKSQIQNTLWHPSKLVLDLAPSKLQS